MLTDFGLARMTQYTQAFFRTTTHDATAGSVRWTAYEIFDSDLQSESDDDHSSEEDKLTHKFAGVSASSAAPSYIALAVPSASDENLDGANLNSGPQGRGRSEDKDSEGHHTKETDMWAFGMVIYVRESIWTPHIFLNVIEGNNN